MLSGLIHLRATNEASINRMVLRNKFRNREVYLIKKKCDEGVLMECNEQV